MNDAPREEPEDDGFEALEPVIDHSTRRSRRYPQSRGRTISLRFDLIGGRMRLLAHGVSVGGDDPEGRSGWLDHDLTYLRYLIEETRQVWHDNVIHFSVGPRRKRWFPYTSWFPDLTPEQRNVIMLRLARAGNKLFDALFEHGDDALQELGKDLADALRGGEQLICVTSDTLFAPWSMIYTPPEPSENLERADADWSFAGFWGHGHLVEQAMERDRDADSRVHRVKDQIHVGMNVNYMLDQEFAPHLCVEPVVKLLKASSTLVVEVRTTRTEVGTAFNGGNPLLDQISYFNCHIRPINFGPLHGQCEFLLDEPVRASDFQQWLHGKGMASTPIVFVNGCRGGNNSAHVHPTFGPIMLRHGAKCLLGPQVDVPPRFATTYALEFFRRFLCSPARIGDVVHGLAHLLADAGSPVGLTISLYRGLDTHLDPAFQTVLS